MVKKNETLLTESGRAYKAPNVVANLVNLKLDIPIFGSKAPSKKHALKAVNSREHPPNSHTKKTDSQRILI